MEANTRKEKAMRKMKLYLVIIFGLCAILFVGILNKGYEYYEPEICLKYPTFRMVFLKPDLADNYKINELLISTKKKLIQYNKVYALNERLGEAAKIIAVVLLQLFLTFLFIKFFEKYQYRYLIIDVLLFLFSAFTLFILTSLGLIKNNKLVLIVLIVVFNFLFNYLLRNFFFSKMANKI
jgi:hypothetical protein